MGGKAPLRAVEINVINKKKHAYAYTSKHTSIQDSLPDVAHEKCNPLGEAEEQQTTRPIPTHALPRDTTKYASILVTIPNIE